MGLVETEMLRCERREWLDTDSDYEPTGEQCPNEAEFIHCSDWAKVCKEHKCRHSTSIETPESLGWQVPGPTTAMLLAERDEARELVRRLISGLDDPLAYLSFEHAPEQITRELLPVVDLADDAIARWNAIVK
jgi:hypothetical protein